MQSDDEGAGAIAGDEDLEEDENNGIVELTDPFLPDGKWNPQHLRTIIHVLDSYHISHDAYSELRLSSRSILPPLHQIKIEKKRMSTKINYYKCGTVSLLALERDCLTC